MTMKSWQFDEFGDFANLTLRDVPIPEPKEGEALVKIHYAGLNPADKFLVMGRYPTSAKLPFSVGRDGCGEIVSSSGRFKPGDMVVHLRSNVGIERDGTYAQYVAVPETVLAPLPDFWNAQQGAANPLVMLTNWQALVIAGQVKPNENVVITGASGGIGTSALLLAKAVGANTIALSRSPEKREQLLALGADYALDTNQNSLVRAIKDLGGADIVLENICGEFLQKSVDMCNTHGRICVIGALGGIASTINPLKILFKRLEIHGIHGDDYTTANLHQAWKGVVAALEKGKDSIPIDKVFAFDQLHEAYDHLRHGPMGKVIVGPAFEV